MGCLRSAVIAGAILLNVVAMGWMLLVLALGGAWGEALVLSTNDALIGAILLMCGLFGNLLLATLLWKGRRAHRRHQRQQVTAGEYPIRSL